MVDFIIVVSWIETFYLDQPYIPFEKFGLIFTPVFFKNTSEIRGYQSNYKGLRIVLSNNNIIVSNSLHKFFKGNNYSDFSRKELYNAIDDLCGKFQIEASKWEIKQLEFGLNIFEFELMHQILDCILSYKNTEFDRMKHKTQNYGKKFSKSEYSIKFYDKRMQVKFMDKLNLDFNILRIEIAYNNRRKLPKGLLTLSDLKNENCIKSLFDELDRIIQKIEFDESMDLRESTLDERMLYYASMNPNFLKAEMMYNKSQVRTIKRNIRVIKEKYMYKNLRDNLRKELKNKYIELYCG